MNDERELPEIVIETSWEVCNKVGGIYAVLSTRAKTLTERFGHGSVAFIGPDVWSEDNPCPYFREYSEDGIGTGHLNDWRETARREGLNVRVGEWLIPGTPVAILVDFRKYFVMKNEIYARLWEDFGVDSLHAYGDYDEASMFAYGTAKTAESLYNYYHFDEKRVVFHCNEWMTGLAALYVQKHLPRVGTLFTTHATSIGRSICGNRKPLYEYLYNYNGDQMAWELNMQSKHSIEKQTAKYVDCFTTVSGVTAEECRVLLDKACDTVLPNGFEDDFVPKGQAFITKRREARETLLRIANCLTGKSFSDDTLIVSTSGRYEFLNKGIDVFLSSLSRLRYDNRLDRDILAFVFVPGWVDRAREDLISRMQTHKEYDSPLPYPLLTHWMHNQERDAVLSMCAWIDMWNKASDKVNVIFVPCYLTGNDGIIDLPYYDVLPANDLCVYASYYEPWGYTPLEATAFSVPCITTDLAGFGVWVNDELGKQGALADGVMVVHRTDHNFNDVADNIKEAILAYSQLSKEERKRIKHNARDISRKALWKNFITYYYDAYDIALRKAALRNAGKDKQEQLNK